MGSSLDQFLLLNIFISVIVRWNKERRLFENHLTYPKQGTGQGWDIYIYTYAVYLDYPG
jgi:hypothetical protein